MEIDDTLRTVYTATVEQRDGEYVLRVPDREVDLETLRVEETYRVALTEHSVADSQSDDGTNRRSESEADADTPADNEVGGADRSTKVAGERSPAPPVSSGDSRRVEIESLGDQGDGIARIDRGYVVIVPDTEVGERVEIEIESATDSVAFAEVTERISYYD